MCRECMTCGGVLLVHPEHILSFKLMGLENIINGKDKIGSTLLHMQEFFNKFSRDIVDESDDIFDVKLELIYTMGMQRPIEFSPQRWTCVQQVLELVRRFAPQVARGSPASMEVHTGAPGRFPRTRILDEHGQRQLLNCIAKCICEVGLEGFPIARQSRPIRQAVIQYLTKPTLSPDEIARVESPEPNGFWSKATTQSLLLLRGLLAGGVIPFAFRQKRWRVQYGLDPRRRPHTKLAVPYRAKDSPTLRSEFSHPDVVIVLTCLSHYYGGIDDDDLFLSFDHLLQSEHAEMEYQEWVRDAPHLPTAFRQLNGINLKDRLLCTERIFPALCNAKNVIDYFLTHLVFPKEMREFPHKLSASGWDIGQSKMLATSGFSGTNDSRIFLPLDVGHLDLPEQEHTNALVLEHLLRPENSVVHIPCRAEIGDSTAGKILDMVTRMNPTVQVILDVGAQILEMNNQEVAKEWLERVQDHEHVQAAVFFNEDDELSVLDRDGQVEPFQISPFASHLEVCLVFLDEAHTRGIDLKLPEHYRAAVTLGVNLTKDRLVQACMRMRKLGQGQTVVFGVPEEISRQLHSQATVLGHVQVDVSHVLYWAITQTWMGIRQNMPLWAVQGRRFGTQRGLWACAYLSDGELSLSANDAKRFLEDEAQNLKHRYQPTVVPDTRPSPLAHRDVNQQRIDDRCRQFHILEHATAVLQEVQERELSPEIVQQREIQKPCPAEPAHHRIHPEVRAFITHGLLQSDSKAFKPAFETLRQTSAASYIDVSQFPRDVLVTVEFASTIQYSDPASCLDAYQRPVQWVLTSIGNGNDNVIKHLVVISPFEADMLLEDIQRSTRVTLHLYAPRPNLGIRPIDHLELYRISAIPRSPSLPRKYIVQLNLFAGQLYVDSFDEYVEVCDMLGLAWQEVEEGSTIAADGFIVRKYDGQVNHISGFVDSPVVFLQVLLTKIRKNCEGIAKTHMGALLDGRLLSSSDFRMENFDDRVQNAQQLRMFSGRTSNPG